MKILLLIIKLKKIKNDELIEKEIEKANQEKLKLEEEEQRKKQ